MEPNSSGLRWATLIKRRKYNVPGRNSLLDIDGDHSLVYWRFLIGGLDGFSHSIVYLKCATNNRKETVCGLFEEAISKLGVPSRV